MITFGDAHLRNGGSEPIPCVSANMCDGNNYGSHADHADWGIDGVIAPFWADVVTSGTEILDTQWTNELNTWNHDDGYLLHSLDPVFPVFPIHIYL